jgi:hypothetical protein
MNSLFTKLADGEYQNVNIEGYAEKFNTIQYIKISVQIENKNIIQIKVPKYLNPIMGTLLPLYYYRDKEKNEINLLRKWGYSIPWRLKQQATQAYFCG